MNEHIELLEPSAGSDNNKRNIIIYSGCLVIFVCFVCLGVAGLAGGVLLWQEYSDEWLAAGAEMLNTPAPTVKTPPTAVSTSETPLNSGSDVSDILSETEVATQPAATVDLAAVPAAIIQVPLPANADEIVSALYDINYPFHDYFEVAVRLDGYTGERTVPGRNYQVGDSRIFYHNEDEIEATLVATTEHTYFWVQNELDVEKTAVVEAANRFEREYYPSLQNLFGQVWEPGVDNDPRLSVLHVTGGEDAELGYFYRNNEYPADIFIDSNEQEMVYMNMDSLQVGETLYDATLVHEIQHLIQWHMDPNETAWLNEGLSQLAEIYLGFTNTAETIDYIENPDTQLNTWTYEEDEVYAHYSAAYLFVVYLWEQLGDTAMQELSRHPANGLASVKAVLAGFAPDMTIEQLTADWAVANYLDSQGEANPRYAYQKLDIRAPRFRTTVEQGEPFEEVTSLPQFGVHYIDLTDLRGETTISFAGDTTVDLIESQFGSEEFFWYAPPADEVNASLTQVFDLAGASQASLSYAVWYDLEEDFDYAFVSISTDGGDSWVKLQPGDRDEGYNGRSANKQGANDGWIQETISLDQFTGKNVIVRFDVLTDSAITGQGFALADITLEGSADFTRINNDIEGWQAEGFVYTGGQLPQIWSVRLITIDPVSREAVVTPIELNDLNQAERQFDFGKDGGVLMIMPQNPFVVDSANYWLKVAQ